MEINLAPNFTDEVSVGLLGEPTISAPNGTFGSNANSHDGSCAVNGTDEYRDFYLTAQFVTGLFIYPILCVTGIIGNSLSIVVLSHKDMATSTNVYLIALCISDSLKLLNDFLYFVMLVISLHNPTAAEAMIVNVYPYAHYVMQVGLSVTAWLTVSVAFDRYAFVCYPSRAKSLCTIVRARMVVISVYASMVLLSIPTAFRYRLQTVHDSLNNETCQQVVVTELGQNQEFMIPYTWVQNLIRGIIPVFILIFLNARIINVLRKERVKGKKLSSRNRITLMLIAMIVLFIVCITPDAIMSTFFGNGYIEEGPMVKGIREITDSLVTFNSAVNFILYCSLSVLFRNTFARIFLGRRFVRARSGSCRPVSMTSAAPNETHGRRKSGGRLSQRMKNVEYTDLCQESPPKEKKKKMKKHTQAKVDVERSHSIHSNGVANGDNSGVWLGYDNEADLVFEQTGGVWLGPVTTCKYNNNSTEPGAHTNDNSGTDSSRGVSSSTCSKEDSQSDSNPRPDVSSNATSISGYYTDKGSTPDDVGDNDNLQISPGGGQTLSTKHPDIDKKKSRKLSWRLDTSSSPEGSPTITESSNDSPRKDYLRQDSSSTELLTRDDNSDRERPLIQIVHRNGISESSLV